MSTLLDEARIRPEVGFDVQHFKETPDLVVIGNAVPRSNPEVEWVESMGWERISMPQALARFVLDDRQPLVVAGTHGKTTTTSMASWMLHELGADPGFLIGGVPVDLGRSFRLGSGSRFVIEGDEYNASYFDRGPKFLHYRPETLILTSVEHDHVDLYKTPEDLLRAFATLIDGLPPSGHLIACGDSDQVRELAASAPCRVTLYGMNEGNQARATAQAAGTRPWVFEGPGGVQAELSLAMPGLHNLSNALAVWAAGCAEGFDPQRVADALEKFGGVLRRLQEVGTVDGVTVVDDFAHHPTAVGASLQGMREKYPGRRLVPIFEPRSLTAGREFFQQAYREAFSAADRVILAPIFYAERLAEDERLDRSVLVEDLERLGIPAVCANDLDEVLEIALAEAVSGDVLVTMSSGAFGSLPSRLLDGLKGRC